MGPYVSILGALTVFLGVFLGRNRYGVVCVVLGLVLVLLGM